MPPGGTGRGTGSADYDGRQDVLVDLLAQDGGRLDDRALRRRESSKQATDDHDEIGRSVSGPHGGYQQGKAAGPPVYVGRHSRADQFGDLADGERREGE